MRFLLLGIVTLVFIASYVLLVSNKSRIEKVIQQNPITIGQSKSYSSIPVLTKTTDFPVISAQGVYAIDLDSRTPLYQKNPEMLLLPASTTKIITALVALDNYNPDSIVEIKGVRVDGQKMGLTKGEKIKVEDLLYGLLVYSANDAAEELARNYPGGRDNFINLMNQKAKELHLESSNFQNPTGLDGVKQLTSAKDLAMLAEVAMRNQNFAKIVGTKEVSVESVDGKTVHKLTNINQLLGEVPGVVGVKTGWTENARENLVTYVERENHKIMLVVLGSQDRFGETKELINWIFSNYKWEEVRYP
ncbi:D-alanyl-D-alanine carboxypeptidase [Candidatus Woesebacteria bacterium]|nr:D-alanyl-D-alanine carboxypeptidase [Candidatus Woesebacteria bacterium]